MTYKCNLRCAYCSESSKEIGDTIGYEHIRIFLGEIFKRWKIRNILDGENAEDVLHIFITGGGEPSYDFEVLSSTFRLIHEKSQNNGIPVNISITTNGVCDESARKLIAANCDRIMVSYDGLPELQNRNRKTAKGFTTSETVEESIRFFANNAKHPVTIRTTLWYEDVNKLREMADYIFTNYANNIIWSVFPVNPYGRAWARIRNSNNLDKYDFAAGFVDVVNYVKEKYRGCSVETSFFDPTTKAFFCGGLACSVKTPWLLPGGAVVACMEQGGRVPFAKIANGRFELTDLHSDALLAMTQKKLEECRKCLVYRFCKGGCPAAHITNRKNGLKGIPWSCEMYVRFGRIMIESLLSGQNFFGWHLEPINAKGLSSGDAFKMVKEK